jgi:hypothetical protein
MFEKLCQTLSSFQPLSYDKVIQGGRGIENAFRLDPQGYLRPSMVFAGSWLERQHHQAIGT